MTKSPLGTARAVTIASLQPTMKWSAHATNGYPRSRFPYVSVDLQTVKDLRYELVIWKAVNGQRGNIIYQAKDLTKNEHKVQTPLAPDTLFFWSVRARFTIDGRRRVTEWTIADHPCIPDRFTKVRPGILCGREYARRTGRIHGDHYLHFKTPGAEKAI